jgi:TAF RNA Polymerase I subunit A
MTRNSPEEAQKYLELIAFRFPDNPIIQLLLYNFYDSVSETATRRKDLARKVVTADPLADIDTVIKPFVNMSESPMEVCQLMIHRLDYVQGDIWVWKTLVEALQGIPKDDVSTLWGDRTEWWPEVHFDTHQIGSMDLRQDAGVICILLHS